MKDKNTVEGWIESMSIKKAETVALGSTTVAFALTVLLAGSGYAVEANPLASGTIETLGWVGASIVALLGEVLIIEGYRRVVAPRRPRIALVGSWSVASVGVLDVVLNLWILSRVGVPDGVSGRLLGSIAIVSIAAILLARRGLVVEESRYWIGGVNSGLLSRKTAALVALSFMIVVAPVGGIAISGSYSSANAKIIAASDEWSYTGTSHSVSSEADTPTDVYRYDNKFYVIDYTADSVFVYDIDWGYTGTSYDVSAQGNYPKTIYRGNDGNWYIAFSNNFVSEYDSSFNHVTDYDLSGQLNSQTGIYQNESGYWFVTAEGENVYVYNSE